MDSQAKEAEQNNPNYYEQDAPPEDYYRQPNDDPNAGFYPPPPPAAVPAGPRRPGQRSPPSSSRPAEEERGSSAYSGAGRRRPQMTMIPPQRGGGGGGPGLPSGGPRGRAAPVRRLEEPGLDAYGYGEEPDAAYAFGDSSTNLVERPSEGRGDRGANGARGQGRPVYPQRGEEGGYNGGGGGYDNQPQQRQQDYGRERDDYGGSRGLGRDPLTQRRGDMVSPPPPVSVRDRERNASVASSAGGRGGRDVRPRKTGGPPKPTISKGDVPFEEMTAFFEEISNLQDALRSTSEKIDEIGQLQRRLLSLPSSDDPQAIAIQNSLAQLTTQLRSEFNALKKQIQVLSQGNANLGALIPLNQSLYNLTLDDLERRKPPVDSLTAKFRGLVQKYTEVERDNRQRNRVRLERQVKIVNPGLPREELERVVKDAEAGGGGDLFSQALLQSNGQRSFAARGALREAESRAKELARIEETITELAQLFNDVAILVEAQDVVIQQVEQTAITVESETEKGREDTKKAVVSARAARKSRKWCCIIFSIIILIVLIIVFVEVILPIIQKNSKSSASSTPSSSTSSSSSPSTNTNAVQNFLTATDSSTDSTLPTSDSTLPASSSPSSLIPSSSAPLTNPTQSSSSLSASLSARSKSTISPTNRKHLRRAGVNART